MIRFKTLLLLAVILSAETSLSRAQEIPVPSTRLERPRLPAQLDRATLQTYLDTIEEPRIASALKVSYFGGRGRSKSFPISEGFAMLQDAIEKEPVASKRWFYLQNVRGWASFRNPELSTSEGFAAYTELFEQADSAKAAGTVYAVQTAVNDWVSTVSNKLRKLRDDEGQSLLYHEHTSEVLLLAWKAYLSLLKQTEGRWNGQEADWSRAINLAHISGEFVAILDESLNDPELPKSFPLLYGAATALRYTDSKRALELFSQAKVLLPEDESGKLLAHTLQSRVVARFFTDWQELLKAEEQSQKAMKVAAARVAVLNSGYADLLRLQWETKDEAGVSDTLKVLSAPLAPEQEVNAVTKVLSGLWSKDRTVTILANHLENLLQTFLHSPRERSLPAELEARWRLGWLLVEQKQTDQAGRVLDLSALGIDEEKVDSRSQYFLNNIRDMQRKLQASDTTGF